MSGSTYAWVPGEDAIIRVSKSTVGAVDWCLKQLWLEKTLPVRRDSTEAMTVGNDVHNALEHFYHRMAEEPALIEKAHVAMQDGRTKEAYGIFNSKFPTPHEMTENGWRDDRDIESGQPFYAAPFTDNREWLIRHEMDRLKHVDDPEGFLPVGNELRVESRITYDVPDFGPTDVQFVGIIDRIFATEDGNLALLELKTGKWSPAKRSQMRREMAYYKFLLENADPESLPENIRGRTITHWGWRFPKASKWHYEKATKRAETAMHRRIAKLLTAYLTEDFEATKDDFKCGYCDYMEYCPKYTPFKQEAMT